MVPVWFSFNSSAGFLDRTQPEFETPRFRRPAGRVSGSHHRVSFRRLQSHRQRRLRETEYGDSFVNGVVTDQGFLRSAREINVHLIPPAFERIFQSPKWLGGDKVKHVIEPRIDYKFVDGIDNFNNIIRFDENDLMNDTDQVTLSLTNRLFVKDKNGNVNEVMSWEVAQSRYFDPTFGGAVIPGQRNVVESTEDLDGFDFLDGPRNYSPIVSILRFQHVVGFEWRVDYDPLLGRISNTSFNGNVRLSKYFFSDRTYRGQRPDPVVAAPAIRSTCCWRSAIKTAKAGMPLSMRFTTCTAHILDFATTEITYNTDCCGISVEYRRYNFGVRDDTQYRLSFTIANVGSFGNMRKQEQNLLAIGDHRSPLMASSSSTRELSGFVIDVVLEIRQAALQRLQLVGQVQAGQDSRASGVDVAGAHGDGGHQVVHFLREMFNPARLLGSHQGISLVEDGDTDRFRVRHCFSLSFFARKTRKTAAATY